MGRALINKIKDVYYPILAAFCIPANILTIVILYRGNCGLSNCISVYMVAMATADLLVVVCNVMLYQIFMQSFRIPFLSYTSVRIVILYVSSVSVGLSVYYTVFFTFDRFVAISGLKFKTKYCTVRIANTLITIVSILVFLWFIPNLFAYEPREIINNVSFGTRPRLEFYSSPIGAVYAKATPILVPWFSVAAILLINCMTVKRIIVANKSRRALRCKDAANQSDPEIKSRMKSITLLFTVSGSYVILWMGVAVFGSMTVYRRADYNSREVIAAETGYMLMYLSSCNNTCIYVATQSKFREQLKTVLKTLLNFIPVLVKQI